MENKFITITLNDDDDDDDDNVDDDDDDDVKEQTRKNPRDIGQIKTDDPNKLWQRTKH